ncbi:fas1 domain-containing [Trichoderma cornu-damae]|uniref:Fas1 domain-containing n=1 Tax=Trichoderma cornu-damae TaxID=654480 RepID=A0A9P8TZG3_9HYPO|nr:fas1 domain-containing [Trichoderma cornu-damae]
MRFSGLLRLSLFATTTAATTAADQDQARPPAPAPVPAQEALHRLPAHPPPGHLPVMAPAAGSGIDSQVQPAVLLYDILGTQRSLTTFFSLARLHEATSQPLSDPKTNTTVLAPNNIVIEDLPLKPWETPGDYASLGSQAYDGSGGKDRADENLRRFVQAHLVVGTSPWEAGVRAKTAAGKELWWETRKGKDGKEKRVVMPDEVEVDRVASRVANGEVWILNGVLNSA